MRKESYIGVDTWLLVGMAARIALGIGLHSGATYEGLPAETAERRKRLFFSLYMMDRYVRSVYFVKKYIALIYSLSVVSTTLGRPFAIHDDDIDISVTLHPSTPNIINSAPRY